MNFPFSPHRARLESVNSELRSELSTNKYELSFSPHRARLESVISELRSELSTNRDELNVTKDEHEQLEIEFEKQHALQAEFMKEFNEKENRFKHK